MYQEIYCKITSAKRGTDADVVKVLMFSADAPENKEMAPYLKMMITT
jgi:hypothetical protein